MPTDYSTEASWVMVLIQGQMLTYGSKQQLEPAILSSWKEVSPTKYVYTVRSSAKFSDGTPVTAADVAYTYNLQLNPKVGAQEAGLFTSVKSATASGNKVIVKLKHPDSLVKFLPASIAGFVYEKSSVEKDLTNYGTPNALPVGAGPYMVSQYTDSQITLVRNPYYYGPKAKWSTIVFKGIPDSETLLLALRSGEIDGTFSAEGSQAKQYKSFSNLQGFPLDAWSGLTMDMTEKPFNNINVRKALYYATDVKGIDAAVGAGYWKKAVTVNDPSIYSASLPTSKISSLYSKIQTFPFSLKKAKAALAASPVPSGFSTTLNVPEDSPGDSLTAQILKNDWAKIGVKLNIRLMPGGPRFQIILNHKPNLGIQIIGNAPDAPDPHELPWEYFSSQQAAVNGNNSSNYRNSTVDKLLNTAAESSNSKLAALDTLQAAILASKSVPIINLGWEDGLIAVKKGWSFSNLTAFSPTTDWLPDLHTS